MQPVLAYLYRVKTYWFPNLALGNIWPISWLKRRLLKKVRREFVEIEGHTLHLDPIDSLEICVNGYYEPFLTRLVKKQIQAGDTVLDVGANIGYFTLLFARQVGPKGRVFAFEPDPANFALLKENVERNGYTNVTLVQKAVADRPQTVNLFLSTEVLGDHRIFDTGDGRQSIPVEAVRLDDYLAELDGRIDVIKMDIQGAEYAALQGMSALLDKHPQVRLYIEYWPYGLQQAGTDPGAVLELLRNKGFELRDVRNPNRPIGASQLKRLLRSASVESWTHADLVCCRKFAP